MKSALVVGGDSTIGAALMQSLAAENIPVTATSRRKDSSLLYLNLADDPAQWPALPHADIAYFCAAITKLDMCENSPEAARKINVTHMQALAERLQKNGTFIIFLSSNQVFDGTLPHRKTTDAACPVNAYGKQKAEFEQWLLARPTPSAVLRLTKVISTPLPMLAQWKNALQKNEPVEAFDDLVFAPLPLSNVLESLLELGEKKHAGIHHLSGPRDISYYDIAVKLAETLGVNTKLVKPISATSKNIPPHFLPKHGTLECNKTIPEAEQFIL